MRRTAAIELDQPFEFEGGTVSKTWTDARTGERFIRGVASGVKVDRDGERVSKNAIRKMAEQAQRGGVKLTSSHQQDWATEIGDVVKATHDPETDELVVDCKLPAEGHDPIADKAWNTITKHGVRLGFSIGGKLRKAYFEVADFGKRKVLDEIGLRHVALTANPSYADSFAEAVAKSYTATEDEIDALPVFEVSDDEDLASDEVLKGLAPSTQGQGGDSKTGDRNAGSRKKGTPFDTEDPEGDDGEPQPEEEMSEEEDPQAAPPEQEDAQDPENDLDDGEEDPVEGEDAQVAPEPEAMHIACPNCGHEFAQPLPAEGDMSLTAPDEDENLPGDDEDPEDPPARAEEKPESDEDLDEEERPSRPDKTPKKPFGKTAEEKNMPLNDTLEMLSGLVEKDASAADTPDEETVTKTDQEPSDVLKMVAASHEALAGRLDGIEGSLGEAFGLVAKAIQDQQAILNELPVGRRSVARILPTRDEVEDGEVGKTVEKAVEEAPDALSALKILNQTTYGIQ